jgi:hypothetical protein
MAELRFDNYAPRNRIELAFGSVVRLPHDFDALEQIARVARRAITHAAILSAQVKLLQAQARAQLAAHERVVELERTKYRVLLARLDAVIGMKEDADVER